ncbi:MULTISPECIES: 3'(2'),5'-bisphosphate nucleotidase CysQ [Rhizobium]|jgi:3'(2'), 5'-bisphosphate nucleotidase|uniref:3'(2'),5'-bisphosphate nucleotidase CysQ n=1 Tax=Rhizobium TaxID=379 RepID=UPI001032419D|nr:MULTISPECIES: 3'(2'),5'-bisphosphate nucleotidase CysQ [Rhizobium]MCJ9691983.1 3'(2'),5'-bisphosphate nucleotidase CysQ [Rhizobium sp. PRIMUS64]MDI5923150.1 3'(2'),5'-bisphosphate nucleotidase CysQ [Rhizobium leguminosarum]NKJ95597.1 3'(2'),5'-bisphosphate nucleotidase CysQ [Rhizobium leguminosarum bv. viciae]QIO60237.1 3'(2'),5'-bisphosphate nucleotidase CysQ [Rhizobium leguminosarum bv. trifolii]TAV12467.1 3'(2'),5'-bisphosphate nucleotidase [Rhizobium leguminosarum]
MLRTFEKAALEAGKAIITVLREGFPVAMKADASPVTVADEEAERIILAHLARDYPEIPVVAEESVAAGKVPDIAGRGFFLVDPLDGTREFVDGRQEFTVNIAYIENGAPVAGIVYAPALGLAFSGERGHAERLVVADDFTVGARSTITVREQPDDRLALASLRHNSPETGSFLADHAIFKCTNIGSSLKFCLLAEGKADVYPRFTRTMEWDTAAGDAVLRAAGGSTVTLDGTPLTYGKTGTAADFDFANPNFISWGGRKRVLEPA